METIVITIDAEKMSMRRRRRPLFRMSRKSLRGATIKIQSEMTSAITEKSIEKVVSDYIVIGLEDY